MFQVPGDKNIRKLYSVIVLSVLLLFVVFSVFFIATETTHDCCGSDCPVCACIQFCESMLRQIYGDSISHGVIICAVLFCVLFSLYLYNIIPETLVSQSVRMDN